MTSKEDGDQPSKTLSGASLMALIFCGGVMPLALISSFYQPVIELDSFRRRPLSLSALVFSIAAHACILNNLLVPKGVLPASVAGGLITVLLLFKPNAM